MLSHITLLKIILLSSVMEVLTYKTTAVPLLLQKEIIINNLIETDKICDPKYVMSAGTAWLRLHPGKNLYDLQTTMRDLGLNTIIMARAVDGDYKLCLPNTTSTSGLRFVADFISNPHIITQIPIQSSEEKDNVRYAGYSCSSRYASKISDMAPPKIEDIPNMDIHAQLQWAGIKFNVEHVIVNPDEELSRDLERAQTQGVHIVKRELTPFRARKERIFAHIDPNTEHYVSAFGILEKKSDDGKATSELVVHLPTYLHELDEK